MKLNREQIIKALECCQKRKCQNCTYDVFGNPLSNCRVKKHALALIKELTEENAMQVIIAIELDKQVQLLAEELEGMKADTVRKMQERAKEKAYTNNYCQEVVLVDDIDQIAKDMLEGKHEES